MAKRKLKKTDNIMAKQKLTKNRQYLCLLSVFLLAMLVSVFCQFAFGHDIVCLFFSFLLSLILSVFCQFPFELKKDRQYRGQREAYIRQTITWPKEN
jgi:uncharacterized membrane protein YjjP (DUF1212 family)